MMVEILSELRRPKLKDTSDCTIIKTSSNSALTRLSKLSSNNLASSCCSSRPSFSVSLITMMMMMMMISVIISATYFSSTLALEGNSTNQVDFVGFNKSTRINEVNQNNNNNYENNKNDKVRFTELGLNATVSSRLNALDSKYLASQVLSASQPESTLAPVDHKAAISSNLEAADEELNFDNNATSILNYDRPLQTTTTSSSLVNGPLDPGASEISKRLQFDKIEIQTTTQSVLDAGQPLSSEDRYLEKPDGLVSTSKVALKLSGSNVEDSSANLDSSSSSSSSSSSVFVKESANIVELDLSKSMRKADGINPMNDMTADTSNTTSNFLSSSSASIRKSFGAKNSSALIDLFLKKKPYSKFWSVEQKWDDIFRRALELQDLMTKNAVKSFVKDLESFADISISSKCRDDIKYIQDYAKSSRNVRWLTHMADSFGKPEPGMLTGNMANMGHVIQCIKTRAPARFSNYSFDERYFEIQTRELGERFRGKYCLTSIRPVMPEKPRFVSRFTSLMNVNLLSNLSYSGLPIDFLNGLLQDYSIPVNKLPIREIERRRNSPVVYLDEMPFESQLYNYLISQRNFMYTLPKFAGVCYPSSCSRLDIMSIEQATNNDKHQVVDIEFDCEMEELDAWDWFNTSRLICYVLLSLIVSLFASASLFRHIIKDRLKLEKRINRSGGIMADLLNISEYLSIDKCSGILFIKTKIASPFLDETKIENERSTSIDALKGFLILILVYSQLVHLGCLPVPFMWTKWIDAMFPFYRSPITQIFLNTSIWTEAFYIISGYIVSCKILENYRPKWGQLKAYGLPNLVEFIGYRFVRLIMPMIGFFLLNYTWPRLSNGFVLQDQAKKIIEPCDNYGWFNFLLFHNHNQLNETCLWPSHVSATFFQLHLISYPILLMLLYSFKIRITQSYSKRLISKLVTLFAMTTILGLSLFGLVYPAIKSVNQQLVVPFLIDYIDYDNYQRVLEWTVMPTYNHLTSYMVGILIAYLVVRKRLLKEFEPHSNEPTCWYSNRAASFETVSITTSSASSMTINSDNIIKPGRKNNENYQTANFQDDDKLESNFKSSQSNWLKLGLSSLALLLCIISTMISSFWNTLAQPMGESETFWYLIGTKSLFSLSFGYFFYTQIATRRNSNNPFIIIRFLVPIGRMSLSVFYISWLVIWFDLLSSLYQWHPSHYFVFEKFNEIIFMTLIISLVVYGIFEGSLKRVLYSLEAEKRKFRRKKEEESTKGDKRSVIVKAESKLAGFNNMFLAKVDNKTKAKLEEATIDSWQHQESVLSTSEEAGKVIDRNKMLSKGSGAQFSKDKFVTSLQVGGGGGRSGSPATLENQMSVVDRYKLNAELRANYSFASIKLYESQSTADNNFNNNNNK